MSKLHKCPECGEEFSSNPPYRVKLLTDAEARRVFIGQNCNISKELAGMLAKHIAHAIEIKTNRGIKVTNDTQ